MAHDIGFSKSAFARKNKSKSTERTHKVRPYGVRLVRYVISSGEETDKSEFGGFKQIWLKPASKAVKTMALPLGELARSD